MHARHLGVNPSGLLTNLPKNSLSAGQHSSQEEHRFTLPNSESVITSGKVLFFMYGAMLQKFARSGNAFFQRKNRVVIRARLADVDPS